MPISANVLVVDDEQSVQASVADLLRAIGCSATAAASGEEALRLMNGAHLYDVVLCDIVMPRMNGIEFARRAGAAHAETPIVLMTAHADTVDAVIEAGAVPLMKPFSAMTLRRIVDELVGDASD